MRLLWNIILALFWSALWGSVNLTNLSSGFIIGYVVLWFLENTHAIENKNYGKRFWRILTFSIFFFKELLMSNIAVARDVLRLKPKFSPAIIKIPLSLNSDAQIAMLANVITLTPGTITLDVSDDKKFIYVHSMFFEPKEREAFVKSIKDGFELKIKELFET